nr:EOG090X0CFU [Cyclestheria hislopi]
MHYLGKVALLGFISSSVVHWILWIFFYNNADCLNAQKDSPLIITATKILFISCISLLLLCLFSWKCFSTSIHEVIWRSCLLGIIFTEGLLINYSDLPMWQPFGWYMSIMAFFHFSEFTVTSIIRPMALGTDSFLLNHSKAYGIAATMSWLEFFIELLVFPYLKTLNWISYVGIMICLGGEVIRKTAMLTAGSNFDHLIRTRKEEDHKLVTTGIYSLSRHPSYVGWFYWSVGTQFILCNPLCLIAYALASWRFFHDRVYEEEATLLYFFGKEYAVYQSKVPTGLPFINGYQMSELFSS